VDEYKMIKTTLKRLLSKAEINLYQLINLFILQMSVTLLSDVHPGKYDYVICVRISRIWEFHGKNDDEPIKHLDLVLIDKKVSLIFTLKPMTFIN